MFQYSKYDKKIDNVPEKLRYFLLKKENDIHILYYFFYHSATKMEDEQETTHESYGMITLVVSLT